MAGSKSCRVGRQVNTRYQRLGRLALKSETLRISSGALFAHATRFQELRHRWSVEAIIGATRQAPTLKGVPVRGRGFSSLAASVYLRRETMRGIILWLMGVPLVVIIGLYLFHVI